MLEGVGGVRFPSQALPPTEGGQLNIMSTTEILARYATEELEELLQFVETKEGRFQNLKRELKEELAVRADVELWSQPAEAGLQHFDYSNCKEVPF